MMSNRSANKKKPTFMDSDDDDEDEPIIEKPKVQPKQTKRMTAFSDSDEDEEPEFKPRPSAARVAAKKKPIYGDSDDSEDAAPVVKKITPVPVAKPAPVSKKMKFMGLDSDTSDEEVFKPKVAAKDPIERKASVTTPADRKSLRKKQAAAMEEISRKSTKRLRSSVTKPDAEEVKPVQSPPKVQE